MADEDQKEKGSKLWLFSLGVVVESNITGSDYIKVFPTEKFPLESGELGNKKETYDVKTNNASGVKKQAKVTKEDFLVAKWLAGSDPNRMSAPYVYKDATVRIYKYADTDNYYWETQFREPSIQKLELVRYGASNISAKGESYDETSSYYIEFSTLPDDKHIRLKTSNSNRERYVYEFLIDPDRSEAYLKDDAGNSYHLDSANGTATVTGKDKVIVNTVDVEVNATGNMTIKANNLFVNAKAIFQKTVQFLMGSKMGGVGSDSSAVFELDVPLQSSKGADFDGDVTAPHFNEG